MIASAPVNQFVLEGQNLTLHCNVTGNPTPNVTWTKDANQTVLHRGEMYSMADVQRQAAGDYICTAWNGVGVQQNATITVDVHCKLSYTICLQCVFTVLKFLVKG